MENLLGLTFDVKRSCQLCVRCRHSLELDICDTQHYQSVQRTWTQLQTEKTTQTRRPKVKHICKEGEHHLEDHHLEDSFLAEWHNPVLCPISSPGRRSFVVPLTVHDEQHLALVDGSYLQDIAVKELPTTLEASGWVMDNLTTKSPDGGI